MAVQRWRRDLAGAAVGRGSPLGAEPGSRFPSCIPTSGTFCCSAQAPAGAARVPPVAAASSWPGGWTLIPREVTRHLLPSRHPPPDPPHRLQRSHRASLASPGAAHGDSTHGWQWQGRGMEGRVKPGRGLGTGGSGLGWDHPSREERGVPTLVLMQRFACLFGHRAGEKICPFLWGGEGH